MSPAPGVGKPRLCGLPTDQGKFTGTGPCLILKAENATRIQGTLQGQSTLRTLAWSSMGKSGDLGDRPGDKIMALSCRDWDPYCMFSSLGWLLMPSAFHIHATISITVYKQSWGILEPQVKSFRCTLPNLSHTPLPWLFPHQFPLSFPLNSTVPSLRVTCSLSPCALLCAAPLPTARRPSSHCVLFPSKFAIGPRAKPLSPEMIELMFPRHRNPLHN